MIKKILVLVLVVLALGIGVYFIFNNTSFVDDDILNIMPSNEISNNEIKKQDLVSTINIYLINSSTKELEKENRNIPIKELNNTPYLSILNELKKKSTKEGLSCPIPESTKILSSTLKGSTLIIDLSNDFILQDTNNELDKLILQSITKTITNLKEVKNIKINIEGNENSKLGTFDLSSTFASYSFDA